MTLRNKITNEIIVDRNYVDLFNPLKTSFENNLAITKSSIIYNQAQEFYYSDMVISIGKLQIKKEMTVELNTSQPYYEMHFCLEGNSQFTFTEYNKESKFTFNKGEHNIYCHSNLLGIYTNHNKNINNHYLEIVVSKEFIDRIVTNYSNIAHPFKTVHQDRSVSLFKDNLPITNEMYGIIFQICNSNKIGELNRLFIELKAYELIILQLEQYNKKTITFNSTKKAKEHIQYAKEVIEQNIQTPLSLPELALQVGINTFKLKKEFKETFNTTVFGYLQQLRMTRAKSLLENTNQPIKEIATLCGYQYVQHFTTAFKRMYGITPGKIRMR